MSGVARFDDTYMPGWRELWSRALPFLIGIPLVIAMAALLYYASIAARERDAALAQQQRSYEVIALTRRLEGTVAKAESNLARYVISMEADTGRLYQDQWRQAGAQLDALDRATRRDPVQKLHVDNLRAAYIDRGKTLSDIGLRTTYDQKEGSLAKFYQAGKAANLTQITEALDQVIDTENDRLGRRSVAVSRASDVTRDITRTYRLFALALTIAFLTTMWFIRSAIEDRRRESRLAEEEAMRTVELEKAVAARTAELEQAYAQLQHESEERSAAEESLRQMQKMEAVGQLTGGIAHDFNNMLAVVVGGLELARRKVGEVPEEAIRHLDNAMEGANRASALTRRLLSFARTEPNLPDAIQPEELVRGMIDLIDRTIGDQVKVVLNLNADGWTIFADRHQLENAILNLAVNARDAMDARGTLTLSVAQARLKAREIGECMAGEYVRLSVGDTGCGMTPEVIQRAFEPFFTTKPVGKGTGLGLSQIFGFVGQADGEIRILSEQGKGTEVQIYLPRHIGSRASDAVTAVTSQNSRDWERAARQRGLTLLVIEDDPRVLAQTRAALVELGHKPICRDHPGQCIDALNSHRDIAMIISDVMMPDMTGPEMVAALPPAHRSIPVLFITGYAGNVSDNRLFDGHQLLRKPFTLASLSAAIEGTLSGSPRLAAGAAAG